MAATAVDGDVRLLTRTAASSFACMEFDFGPFNSNFGEIMIASKNVSVAFEQCYTTSSREFDPIGTILSKEAGSGSGSCDNFPRPPSTSPSSYYFG